MPLRLSKNRVLLDGIPLNEGKSSNLASAATIDIWSVTGNVVPITGTATISAFSTAPQAGTKRTLLCIGTPTFTHGANFLLPGAANYTATAGDQIEVLAITTTQFRLSVIKASVLPDVQAITDPITGAVSLVGEGGIIGRTNASKKAALLGDSIAAQCLALSPGVSAKYSANSWLGVAMQRLGFPWDIQASDHYAVNGTTTAVILANQIPNLITSGIKYDRVFISSGTNDFNGGVALADTISNTIAILSAITNTGAIAVHIGVLPRGNDAAMTDGKRKALGFNAWLSRYAAENVGIEYIPCGDAIADNSTAFGNALIALMDASILHPIDGGAFWMGNEIYKYYNGKGLNSTLRFADSAADFYHATFNPGGILFDSPNPLLIGGTTAPTGMSTAGTNITWSKSTDTLDNGQTQATVLATLTGIPGGAYLYDDNIGSGAWDTEEIAEGDEIYAQALVRCAGLVANTYPSLQLTENNGTTTQTAIIGDATSGAKPTLPDGIYYLRTPNIPVRAYGGSGNASAFVKLNILGTGAETGTIEIIKFEMRKANIT